ncbi:hypothetical protein [Legionella sp.]|uniref:hypothetical protein n=1 Tax=Legionella sp. TaxID=459 RepID=UPI003CB1B754
MGLSREQHNKICNKILLKKLKAFTKNGVELFERIGISNETLIKRILANPQKPLLSLTWEHCSSSTANGRLGVMRLVLSEQHSKNQS